MHDLIRSIVRDLLSFDGETFRLTYTSAADGAR
jgi:hypothetical protein